MNKKLQRNSRSAILNCIELTVRTRWVCRFSIAVATFFGLELRLSAAKDTKDGSANPYASPAPLPDRISVPSLVCPYCNHTFPLTWAKYFYNFQGNHDCPSCGKRGHLKWTLSYVVRSIGTTILFIGVAATISFVTMPFFGYVSYLVTLPMAYILGLVLDRHYDTTRPNIARIKEDGTKRSIEDHSMETAQVLSDPSEISK
jgi:hypothetical protein